MKDIWANRYEKIEEKIGRDTVEVLVGFNANIDVTYAVEDLELDFRSSEPEDMDRVDSIEDLKSVLRYHVEKEENGEVDLGRLDLDLDGGDESVGGQAGIMANFLSGFHNSVTFYTPLLSQELADLMRKDILYPVYDGGFVLKNVRDSANTDRTKKNRIFEYSNDRGRMILSDKIRGFNPYFREGVADHLEEMDEHLDRVLLSGFHDVKQDVEGSLSNAGDQMSRIETPIHFEFVDTDSERIEAIADHVIPEADSLGLDEHEMDELEEVLDLDITGEEDRVSLGEAYRAAKKLMDRYGLSRVHLHTYRFHVVVTDQDYPVGPEKIRDAMMWGEVQAIRMGDLGRIPELEDTRKSLDMDDKHLKRLDDLEDFGKFFGLENFAEEGFAEVEDYQVSAIPTIIHEDPERVVGMGDVISSGTFVAELK
ncbi:MAG: ADP-dependent glucokinase/phosphofructokinase [Candidatus Nanohaloarchaea archaeon]